MSVRTRRYPGATEEELRREVEELRAELLQARETVRAVIAGEVDTVADGTSGRPTLLHQAQEALRQSESQLRAIFDGALDAMVIADDEGRYVDANPAALELFGVSREQMLGKTAADFTDVNDVDRMWSEFLGEHRMEGEFPLVCPDGTRRIVEFRASANITPGRHLSVMRDVTDRRRMEEELRQSHRLESIGRLAGGIAHDFNNMLSAIMGFATFLREDLPPADPKQEDLSEIVRASERAAELVRQLLAFGRKQVLSPRTVTTGSLVADVARMTARLLREDIELVLEHHADDCLVAVDAAQMQQVLVNLVLNARDALDGPGTITLGTSKLRAPPRAAATMDGLAPGAYAVISVTDTGSGMDESICARVFEPFFSTKEQGKGTGLGLATAYGIVKQSGGHIEVESEPGRGSTFRVYLPRHASESAEMPSPTSAPPRPRGTETVLVVEDEGVVRRLAAQILRRQGYRVLEAREPGDALLVCEQEPGPIHLLLTDVVMPRMRGTELAERITQDRPDIRVLFMSGYAGDEMQQVERVGLVSKPFAPEVLLHAVRQKLDAS